MKQKWALYDIYVEDELVYVGVTCRPSIRLSQHRSSKIIPYFAEMRIVQWFDTQAEAFLAETARINELKPPRNGKGGGPWVGKEPWVVHV